MVEVLWKALKRILRLWLRLTHRRPLRIGLDLDGVADETVYARFEVWAREHVNSPVARGLAGDGLSLPGGELGPQLGVSDAIGNTLWTQFLDSPSGLIYIPTRACRRSMRRLWLWSELHVVTRRDIRYHLEVMRAMTDAYAGMIHPDDVHWAHGQTMGKDLICDAFQLDILVDDQPGYLTEITRQFGVLFGRYQWTERDDEKILDNPRIFRARTWSQVLTWSQRRAIWRSRLKPRNWVADPPPRLTVSGGPTYTRNGLVALLTPDGPMQACAHPNGSGCFCNW